LTSDQHATLDEMFDYHSTDGELDLRAFSQLMTEGFTYSFLDGNLDHAIKGDIRIAIAAGELPMLNLKLMQRLYEYADVHGKRMVCREELKLAIQTIVYGSRQERLQFLFHVTDLDGDGLITAEEMESFLQDFRIHFYRLAASAARVRLTQAEPGTLAWQSITALIAAAVEETERTDTIVSNQTVRAFKTLQEGDGDSFSFSTFARCRSSLPKLYNRLTHLIVGFVHRTHGQVIIGEYFPPSTSPARQHLQAEHLEPKYDGTHDHVEVTEKYSPFTSPSKFTLDALRNSPSFKEALVKIDSSPAPFDAEMSNLGHSGVYIKQ